MASMPVKVRQEGNGAPPINPQSPTKPVKPPWCFDFMQKPAYYREQAGRARRLARSATNRELEALLARMAHDYEDLAVDLETGAVEIPHPELLPQRQR
jgi:hypothetical protein